MTKSGDFNDQRLLECLHCQTILQTTNKQSWVSCLRVKIDKQDNYKTTQAKDGCGIYQPYAKSAHHLDFQPLVLLAHTLDYRSLLLGMFQPISVTLVHSHPPASFSTASLSNFPNSTLSPTTPSFTPGLRGTKPNPCPFICT